MVDEIARRKHVHFMLGSRKEDEREQHLAQTMSDTMIELEARFHRREEMDRLMANLERARNRCWMLQALLASAREGGEPERVVLLRFGVARGLSTHGGGWGGG